MTTAQRKNGPRLEPRTRIKVEFELRMIQIGTRMKTGPLGLF